ncbi:MAG: hypothetical protein P9M11_08880 [Candidatus Tenebribacter burtonii]|jgi:hypothetical protein|nr:hypothetical protein [Candidatus Tenebribacter burtonii]
MIIETIIKNINVLPESSYSMNNPVGVHYSTNKSSPENNFVSEIKILLCDHTDYRDNDFQIITDKYKRIEERIDRNSQIFKQYQSMNFGLGIRPDLIIHKSQSDTNPQNQIFSMECKINPNLNYSDFKKDLFKLMLYKKVLNFSENLYFIANNNTNKILKYFQRYKDDKNYLANSGFCILNIEKYGINPDIII